MCTGYVCQCIQGLLCLYWLLPAWYFVIVLLSFSCVVYLCIIVVDVNSVFENRHTFYLVFGQLFIFVSKIGTFSIEIWHLATYLFCFVGF